MSIINLKELSDTSIAKLAATLNEEVKKREGIIPKPDPKERTLTRKEVIDNIYPILTKVSIFEKLIKTKIKESFQASITVTYSLHHTNYINYSPPSFKLPKLSTRKGYNEIKKITKDAMAIKKEIRSDFVSIYKKLNVSKSNLLFQIEDHCLYPKNTKNRYKTNLVVTLLLIV